MELHKITVKIRLVNYSPKKKRLFVNVGIVTFLILGTIVAIQFAKGYRPNLKDKALQGTGLLNLTSYPKSARVIINDRLTTVTDDKLYLNPNQYQVSIEKDGFHTWTKKLTIKKELVTNTDARLFPLIPATSPLTFYQVRNIALNPDGTKIAYTLNNAPQSITNGLYVHSLTNNLLGSSTLQIAENQNGKDYADSTLIWSPDSTQLLAIFTEKITTTPKNKNEKPKVSEKIISAFLLTTKEKNTGVLSDVTIKLPQIIADWENQIIQINTANLALLPDFLKDILTTKATNVFFSPDKEKVIYSPNTNLKLPENNIGSLLPNINSTIENRDLQKDKTYVFDTKEGTNYEITSASKSANIQKLLLTTPSATTSANLESLKQIKAQNESYYVSNLTWYSNSRQLIYTDYNGINIVDYDNLNSVNINPVVPRQNFAIPSTDGTKLVSLTNINQKPDIFNLISFDLK